MKPSHLLFITFAALQLAGCAIGQKVDYRQVFGKERPFCFQ